MPLHLTDPETVAPTPPPAVEPAAGQPQSSGLTETHKQALFGIFANFYRELGGRWQTTVLAEIWQGPNAVLVNQLNAVPLPPSVAKSLINMLSTIIQAKPEPNATLLAQTGALEALYGIAFDGAPRLDLLPYSALAKTALSPEETRAWVRCCITLNERPQLLEPMVIRTEHSVHLFEFAALKQAWRESFRFINPMSRQPVTAEQLLRLEPHDTAAAGAVKGP